VVGFEERQREEGTKENAEREGRVQCVHHNRAILLPLFCLPDVSQLHIYGTTEENKTPLQSPKLQKAKPKNIEMFSPTSLLLFFSGP
jgi:hypothetical protein